jgi:ubiquinone/menaquinone biosynthesis C-methylase UbiE
MKNEQTELRWKRRKASWIFGGKPIGLTGKEVGLMRRLKMLENLNLGKMILSVGCGTAVELQLLKGRGFVEVGLDPERSFLLEGKKKGTAHDFVQAIGENIPLRANCLDLALLFEVLEHVIDPEVVLNEISRVLKPNGMLFITVPNKLYIFETHGIQICQKQINNLLGVGIPFFSMAPSFVRKKFERARIFSEGEVLSLLRRHDFNPFTMEYLMPSLDTVRQTHLTSAIGHVFFYFSKTPIIKKFGSNLMIISKKRI